MCYLGLKLKYISTKRIEGRIKRKMDALDVGKQGISLKSARKSKSLKGGIRDQDSREIIEDRIVESLEIREGRDRQEGRDREGDRETQEERDPTHTETDTESDPDQEGRRDQVKEWE